MDTFLKAHAVKKRIGKLRQNPNSKLKSKLKLMLSGYQRNDTKAIRNAVEQGADESDADSTYDYNSDLDVLIPQAPKSISPSSPSSKEKSGQDAPQPAAVCSVISQMMQAVNGTLDAKAESVDENSSSQTTDEESEEHKESECLDLSDHCSQESEDQNYSSITENESENQEFSSENSDDESDDLASISLVSDSYSDSQEEIKDVSELELLRNESDRHKLDNTSMYVHHNLTSTSSLSCSEFDSSGYLATAILEKLNQRANNSDKLSVCNMDTAPSSSGYIQINKKKKNTKSKVREKGEESSLPKRKGNEKEKKEHHIAYVSLDASRENLPDFLSSFRDYNFSTSKNITPNLFNAKSGNADFRVKKFNNVKINQYCSELNTSMYSRDDNYKTILKEDRAERTNGTNENMDVDILDDQNAVIPETVKPTSVKFHHVKNGCLVILHHPSQFHVHGKLKVTSLCGTVDIMGYKLKGKHADVFAPKFSFAQTIKTLPLESSQYGLFSKLTALGISVLATEDIVVQLNEFDAVLHLERMDDKTLDYVEAEFASSEIFQMSRRSLANEQFPDVSTKLSCSLYMDQHIKIFQENSVWPEIVKHGRGDNSRGIVCGGKGTGKSTFLKYYINKMVTEGPVVVIDLDPGQAEFTVAGNISVSLVTEPVIGPNFTHLREPIRMLNVGMVNILDNIERYMSAVADLLQHVTKDKKYRQLPWIVNTMGMSNSLGLKVLTCIILLLEPTFLVQMDSDVQNKCFEMLLTSDEIKRVYTENYEEDVMFENVKCSDNFGFKYFMSSHTKLARGENLTARDKRYLCFLSYFGRTLSKNIDSLLGVRPYVVHLNSINIATTGQVDEDSIISIINAKIVALCEDSRIVKSKKFTIEDNALICYGHGLVRGVDLDTESVYLIIGETVENLSRVNVLLYCESHPELTLGEAGLQTGTLVPYRAPLQPHNRQLLKTPKRRFNPLQLLKMKRRV